MEISKFVLNYIFVKTQDLERDTEFIFLIGSPTGTITLHTPSLYGEGRIILYTSSAT